MYCSVCGHQNNDDAEKCEICSSVLNPAGADSTQPKQPMKWFKFLIYFSLWAGAILNLSTGIQLLSGSVYGNKGEADVIYALCPDLKPLDTIIAILSIGLAALLIVTRFKLAGYKKDGPKWITITYLCSAVINLIYVMGINFILPALVAAQVDFASSYASIVIGFIMVVINYIYFKKREHLFVN